MSEKTSVKLGKKTLNRIRERHLDEENKSYNVTLISFLVDYEDMKDEIEDYERYNRESFKENLRWMKEFNKTQDDLNNYQIGSYW
jgi:Lon protease-like protein